MESNISSYTDLIAIAGVRKNCVFVCSLAPAAFSAIRKSHDLFSLDSDQIPKTYLGFRARPHRHIHIEVSRVDYEKLSSDRLEESSVLIRERVRAAMSQLDLSARGYHRVLKLARTIADLAESDDIQSVHLAEVLQYRPKLMLG